MADLLMRSLEIARLVHSIKRYTKPGLTQITFVVGKIFVQPKDFNPVVFLGFPELLQPVR
jgi:hypothetical protein